MKFVVNYSAKLGKYDGNDDVFEWEIETSDPVIEKAYKRALMTGTYFEDVEEFKAILDQAYKEIEKDQIKKLKEEGDDAFALDCFAKSQSPFDCGYKITVSFPDDEFEEPEDETIEEWLTEALTSGDVQLAEEIILEHNTNYSDDLLSKAFEIAEEVGCKDFIDKNKR